MAHFRTKLITVVPEVARYAEDAGVDTIFIDMEVEGKASRQGHLDTHKSAHSLKDIERVRSVLRKAELMVRVNPLSPRTNKETDAVIAAGADRIMLPMFREASEVSTFKAIVAGRVPITFLVETASALGRLPSILPLLDAKDRIHFGLNDLCIDMKLGFLFEVLGGGLLEGPADFCRRARVPFGIGGIGRVGHGSLPAEWIVGEHVRLGSEWVILSRAFHGGAATLTDLRAALDLRQELDLLEEKRAYFSALGNAHLRENQSKLAIRAAELGVKGST